jgi:hypothetical protein
MDFLNDISYIFGDITHSVIKQFVNKLNQMKSPLNKTKLLTLSSAQQRGGKFRRNQKYTSPVAFLFTFFAMK